MNEIENIGIEGKEIELEQVRWEAEKAKKDVKKNYFYNHNDKIG